MPVASVLTAGRSLEGKLSTTSLRQGMEQKEGEKKMRKLQLNGPESEEMMGAAILSWGSHVGTPKWALAASSGAPKEKIGGHARQYFMSPGVSTPLPLTDLTQFHIIICSPLPLTI